MPQQSSSSHSAPRSGNHGSVGQASMPTPPSLWLPLLVWGVSLLLAVFFLLLGFDAPPIDLITRWACVGLVAYLGKRLMPAQESRRQSVTPESQSVDQRPVPHRPFSSLHLPLLLQQFIDEMGRFVPCRGALLVLLDREQEEPEYVVTSGQVPSSVGADLSTLLPKEVFLEVLERKTVVFNSPQELQARLGALRRRTFARQSLFIGSVRRQQHLAFLLLADRVEQNGFLAQDIQAFTVIAEAAILAIENARRFADLQEIEKKQHAMLHGLISAQEQESKIVAEEWQDRISRKLLDVLQGLRGFQNVINQRAPENRERFQQLTAEIDEIAALVRGLTNELHPSVLDDFGVAAAIREYVADVVAGVEEHDPLRVTIQADDVDQQLPNEAKLLLFRITQEALRNVRKHAEARNVHIAFVQEHAGVSLMIKDDGKGFNPDQPHPGHFGLQYMRERAEACGGTFRVVSAQGQGTEVRVNFPTAGAPL